LLIGSRRAYGKKKTVRARRYCLSVIPISVSRLYNYRKEIKNLINSSLIDGTHFRIPNTSPVQEIQEVKNCKPGDDMKINLPQKLPFIDCRLLGIIRELGVTSATLFSVKGGHDREVKNLARIGDEFIYVFIACGSPM
jgi:hypothetical protein